MGEIIYMHIPYQCLLHSAVKVSALMGTASVQVGKVINVRMSEPEYTLLKIYCASVNQCIQDVSRDFELMLIQK